MSDEFTNFLAFRNQQLKDAEAEILRLREVQDMPRGWYNAHLWTDHIPMDMLPFFVFMATRYEPGVLGNFDELYEEFCESNEIPAHVRKMKEFRTWCEDQHVHYYESNH